jgi:hypothetical protein
MAMQAAEDAHVTCDREVSVRSLGVTPPTTAPPTSVFVPATHGPAGGPERGMPPVAVAPMATQLVADGQTTWESDVA